MQRVDFGGCGSGFQILPGSAARSRGVYRSVVGRRSRRQRRQRGVSAGTLCGQFCALGKQDFFLATVDARIICAVTRLLAARFIPGQGSGSKLHVRPKRTTGPDMPERKGKASCRSLLSRETHSFIKQLTSVFSGLRRLTASPFLLPPPLLVKSLCGAGYGGGSISHTRGRRKKFPPLYYTVSSIICNFSCMCFGLTTPYRLTP